MTKVKQYLLLILLGMAGGTIYDFPYIKYIFYNQMLSSMHINNTQLGILTSIYGIGCLILYIPGGILADKMRSKNALVISLFGTAALAVVFGMTLNFVVAIIVWILLALSSAFIFWSAIIKAIRLVGGEENGGKMYGIYYAANGLSAAILNFLALAVYGKVGNGKFGMAAASITMALVIGIIAILLVIFLPNQDAQIGDQDNSPKLKDFKQVVFNPSVWVIAVVFFMTYGLFSGVSYLTPYLADVVGVSNQTSSMLGIVRNYVFLLLAPVSGIIADRFFHSTLRWFTVGYVILAVSLIVIALSTALPMGVIIILSLIPGIMALGLYGIQFSIIGESKIPLSLMGATTGFVSLIGYLPDMVMPTVFGRILDSQKNHGYSTVFLILAAFALVASLGSVVIYKLNQSREKKSSLLAAKEGIDE
ncbi:MFS transporter [Lentilactobacillus kisonensis]|uniref:Transporter, major facilitator family protein n=2 Tax=Lentilactobacillus kisonensis TaxID=481722 RepID=H1LEG6_9LACO|nr:MFS transporter [Lentilactobacillus kisonensis]EHO52467.1 transporter, major facilitator family protein [Lentilactobacillus kisonensis F0435]KRL22947.1 transporter, major facilitator family protein [Lentilactobacillus kisonensis DSM 19906 = JCM 15041]